MTIIYEKTYEIWDNAISVEFKKYPTKWDVEVTYMGYDRYDNDFEQSKKWTFDTLHEAFEWLRDLHDKGEDGIWDYFEEEHWEQCCDDDVDWDDYRA